MNRDFFDTDLVKQRDEIKRIKLSPSDEAEGLSTDSRSAAGSNRSAAELNLPLMARQRKMVEMETARTTEELDRLRRQQENLEREKRELEEMRRKHDDYNKGKQELLEGLNHSLVTLERHEIKTQQLAELLQSVRQRFRTILAEITDIDEESWPEDRVREEIGKALVRVDDARMEYNKAMARIDSVLNTTDPHGENRPILFSEPSSGNADTKTFADWLKTGLAFTLPLVVMLAILCVLIIWKGLGQ